VHARCGNREPIAVADPEPVIDRVPNYQIEGVLGAGGFGIVVRARAATGEVVAIKLAHADREARARLVREIEILGAVGPPWVPKLIGHGTSEGGLSFVVMERLDTPTLADHMARAVGPLDAADIERLIRPLLATLAALHDRGIVHRDLKPENIFVSDARAVLIDFGLARIEARHDSLTGGALGAGTPIYSAPEQIAGTAASPATDVYALGVILYELAVGHPPFFGSDAEVRVAAQSHRPRRPRDFAAISAELETAILDCLAKDPCRRPTLRDLAQRLKPSVATTASDATAPRVAGGRSRLACSVLLFEATGAQAEIRDILARHSGDVVGIVDGIWAAVFSPADGARPAARARAAEAALIGGGLATRSALDRRELATRTRADGSRQILGNVHDGAQARLDAAGTGAIAIPTHTSSSDVATGTFVDFDPHVRLAPFVGRAGVIGQLVAGAVDALQTGPARLAVVVGDHGVGCTRLARELAAALAGADAHVLALALRELPAGSMESYRRVATAVDPDVLAGALGSSDGDAQVLADVLGGPAAPEVIARLRATPNAYRGAAGRGLAHTLVAASTRQPLILIVDDAHLADPATLDAFRIASEHAAPLWICLLSHRPLLDAPAIALPPLVAADAATLARVLLEPAIDIPEAALGKLIARAGGNPRDLAAICRVLHASGAIRRRSRGGDHYLETDALDDRLADGDWIERHEIASLGPALRDHAAALALLVPGFTADDCAGIFDRLAVDTFPLDPRIALDRLRQRSVLEGATTMQFSSGAIREALAASLVPERARLVHAAAAAHFQSQLDGALDHAVLSRIVPHVAAIGDRESAAELLVTLADHVTNQHDYLSAESLYGRALELLASAAPALELRACRGRALMRHRLGRYEASIADTERACELARASGDRLLEADLLLDEATALDWMGEIPRSAARLAEASALLDDDAPARLRVRRLVAEGRSLWRSVGGLAAIDALERAVAEAEPLGDAAYEDLIAALVMLVQLLPSADRLDETERIAGRAIEICEQRGDRLHLLATLGNRQVVSLRRGLPDRAIADLERAAAIGGELGMPIARYRCRLGLADIHRQLGNLSAARRDAELAREVEIRGSAAGTQQTAAFLLLQIAAHEDRTVARTLLASLSREGLPDEVHVFDAIALALADTDDNAAWDRLLADARTNVPEVLADLIEHRAVAAYRRGEHDAARSHLEAALDAAREHEPIAIARLERTLAAWRPS
jgi:tetratricopeptide (TPR) repeat protein/predicted Ser/Thr protein kinase